MNVYELDDTELDALGLARILGVEDDGDWRNRALCAQANPDDFYPDKGESTRPGKSICERCPVRAECLAYGLEERYGIWGGLSERERRKLKASGWAPGDPIPDVTNHHTTGTCDVCGKRSRSVRQHRAAAHPEVQAA